MGYGIPVAWPAVALLPKGAIACVQVLLPQWGPKPLTGPFPDGASKLVPWRNAERRRVLPPHASFFLLTLPSIA
jgi:hypothetical protein